MQMQILTVMLILGAVEAEEALPRVGVDTPIALFQSLYLYLSLYLSRYSSMVLMVLERLGLLRQHFCNCCQCHCYSLYSLHQYLQYLQYLPCRR